MENLDILEIYKFCKESISFNKPKGYVIRATSNIYGINKEVAIKIYNQILKFSDMDTMEYRVDVISKILNGEEIEKPKKVKKDKEPKEEKPKKVRTETMRTEIKAKVTPIVKVEKTDSVDYIVKELCEKGFTLNDLIGMEKYDEKLIAKTRERIIQLKQQIQSKNNQNNNISSDEDDLLEVLEYILNPQKGKLSAKKIYARNYFMNKTNINVQFLLVRDSYFGNKKECSSLAFLITNLRKQNQLSQGFREDYNRGKSKLMEGISQLIEQTEIIER